MNILITGATGFLGSHVIKRLIKKHDLTILNRTTSSLSRISSFVDKLSIYNINNIKKIFVDKNIETIIHLSTNYGRKNETVKEIVNTNVLFPTDLIEVAIENGLKNFINTDTSARIDNSFYASSKKAFLNILYCFHKKNKINIMNFQPEYIYGPGDDSTKFIPFAIENILCNKAVNATNGDQKRDFIFIDDLVDAYELAIDLNPKLKWNSINFEVGTGKSISLRSFFNKVEEITGKKGYIQWGTLPYRDDDMFDSKADIKNINKVLNWTPTHSIEDGLNKTIDWYKRKIR
mgnify:CR=1 FL=1